MLVSQGRSRSILSRRRWARRSRNPMGAESGSAPWGARPECSAARELGRHARPVTGSSGLPPDAMGHPGIGGDLAGHVSCCGFHCASGDSDPAVGLGGHLSSPGGCSLQGGNGTPMRGVECGQCALGVAHLVSHSHRGLFSGRTLARPGSPSASLEALPGWPRSRRAVA